MTTDKTHLLDVFSNTVSRAQKKTCNEYVGGEKKMDDMLKKTKQNKNKNKNKNVSDCARMCQSGTLNVIPHLGFKIVMKIKKMKK